MLSSGGFTTSCFLSALVLFSGAGAKKQQRDGLNIEKSQYSQSDYYGTSCDFSEVDRVDCGYPGITSEECIYTRDCCFTPSDEDGVPWCYHASDSYGPGGDFSLTCEVDDSSREDCGYPGITSQECESTRMCCWQESEVSGTPWCFYPGVNIVTYPQETTSSSSDSTTEYNTTPGTTTDATTTDATTTTATTEATTTFEPPSECTVEPLISGNRFHVADSDLTASSVHDSLFNHYEPWYSRLDQCPPGRDDDCAWSSRDRDGEYITVDLGRDFVILGISTQGDGDDDGFFSEPEYVTLFTLEFSRDGEHFTARGPRYSGNSNSQEINTQYLSEPVVAQYVRLVVHEWENYPSLRWELYGCPMQ